MARLRDERRCDDVLTLADKPLAYRCLALTASIETSRGVPDCFGITAGDHDDQGMSFGALQFAMKPGSLGKLLLDIERRDPSALDTAFGPRAGAIRDVMHSDTPAQLAWARSIQAPKARVINDPWRAMFRKLGTLPACQDAQVAAAQAKFNGARILCGEYGLWSERGVAMMFDVIVQHGSISSLVKHAILGEFETLAVSGREAIEVAKLRVIGRRRAEACRPQYVAQVKARRETIATGHGRIHGRFYNLDAEYGIGLRPFT